MRHFALLLCALPLTLAAQTGCDTASGTAPTTTYSPEQVVTAAALVSSCVPDDDVNRWIASAWYEGGIQNITAAFKQNIVCLASAASQGCEAVTDCVGVTASVVAQECQPSCAGSVWSTCDDQLHIEADCAALGMECGEIAGRPGCYRSQDLVAPDCDVDTFTPRCTNGMPVRCAGSAETGGKEITGLHCDSAGFECAIDDDRGIAFCRGKLGACEGKTFSSLSVSLEQGLKCTGDTLSACVNGGIHDVDCTTLNADFRCFEADGAAYCGLGTDCTPVDGGDGSREDARCDGDDLVTCNVGTSSTVSCAGLGLGACHAELKICLPPFAP